MLARTFGVSVHLKIYGSSFRREGEKFGEAANTGKVQILECVESNGREQLRPIEGETVGLLLSD
jgi:hypothetical protein